MANVILAIVTLVVGFVLAGFGVYESVQSSHRSQVAMAIGSALERESQHIQDLWQENGRAPLASTETTAEAPAHYDSGLFQRDGTYDVSYSASMVGDYYVCATSTDTRSTMQEAMNLVVRDRQGAFVSGQCGVSGTAVADKVVVSLKVG